MKLWGGILIFSLCAIRSQAWDENSPLYLNKKGDAYSYPRFVAKDEGKSIIRYKAADETDTNTYMFCKNVNSKENILTAEIYREVETEAPHTCPTPVTAIVKAEEYQTVPIKCGTNEESSGVQYRVYYELAEAGPDQNIIPGSEFSLLLYKFCFDDEAKEIMYAEYTIDNPQLLENSVLEEEQSHPFSLIPIRYNIMKNLYEENLYNEPRLVGIPEFMPFALLRKPFHLYDNAAPLNEELVEVWSKFLLKIKKKLSKKTKPIKVYSGVYDTKRIHGTAVYIDDTMLPSPYVYWVLLYNEEQTEGVSLIMHNYAFNVTEEKQNLLCDENACPKVGISPEDLPDPLEYKYAQVYCCPASAITKFYPFKQVNNYFEL